MTALGVILITLAVSGLVFLLWLVLEDEQERDWRDLAAAAIRKRQSATWGPGYDPTEGIQPPDVYPDELRGVP